MGSDCDEFALYAIDQNGKVMKIGAIDDLDVTDDLLVTNNWLRYHGFKPLRKFRRRKNWKRLKYHAALVSGMTMAFVTSWVIL